MGRNGMGKTTLIRTIMGLVRPRAGAVSIGGEDVTRDPRVPRRAARHRLCAGRPRHFRRALGAREPGDRRASGRRRGAAWTIARVLELFPRLGQRLRNGGDQLSGGEQQMLAIARALLTNPRVLILDEATEGLAPLIRDGDLEDRPPGARRAASRRCWSTRACPR